MFSVDPHFPAAQTMKRKFPTGGNGVLKLVNKNGLLTMNRNIIIIMKIDDHPTTSSPVTK
jgi:hypothetical protein